MPRISVVVPIFNVEPYLEECLGSIASQSFGDLEVILVDDGSTDGSAAIARDFAARDARFSLLTQPNGGLGKARNTGADAATGEFLAFVDSDDALPRNAYALLLGALEESGSDYAAGNVHRLTRHGTAQAPFLRRVFRETQLGTHVTRFPQMLVDRIVPNKLWRRSFWQQHGLRFPEGVLHEDIPVVLPAMFLARSVDLLAEPVYWYRIREGADRSITQRRVEPKALLDRLAAVQHVSEFLGREHQEEFKRRYDASVVAEDLRYYLNVLELADEDYRTLFLEKVNAFLDQIDPRALQSVPAIERLKWHLVRRRLMPELLEVRRFQREELHERTPVREGGRWYGDYPFRKDPRLAIPDAIYRVDGELKPVVRVEDMRWDDGRLHLGGFAFIEGIGAPARGSQKVTVTALRPGRLARIRLLTSGLRFRTRGTHRPDANAIERYQYIDLAWSGFEAVLDSRRLRRGRRRGADGWDVYVTVRAGGLKRRRTQFLLNVPRPLWAADLPLDGAGIAVTAAPTE
ncbi:MAG TPA: glycosyltransferase, partial [Solirubrobacteraceae bacterium]|nr:glycosyltransferase [Solirubrobacteraceae bacterium]